MTEPAGLEEEAMVVRVDFMSSVLAAIVAVVLSGSVAFAGSGGGGILGSDVLHFKCYLIEDGANPTHVVDLIDQFTPVDPAGLAIPHRVGVGQARMLCTPVAKTVVSGPPGPTVTDPSAVADHYTCYDMRQPNNNNRLSFTDPNTAVTLTNQFGEDTVKVRFSAFLCAPTVKCNPATSPCATGP